MEFSNKEELIVKAQTIKNAEEECSVTPEMVGRALEIIADTLGEKVDPNEAKVTALDALAKAKEAKQSADRAQAAADTAQQTADNTVTEIAHVRNDFLQGDKTLREQLEAKIDKVAEDCVQDGNALMMSINETDKEVAKVSTTAGDAIKAAGVAQAGVNSLNGNLNSLEKRVIAIEDEHNDGKHIPESSTIGAGVDIGENTEIENVRMKINSQTGMMTMTNVNPSPLGNLQNLTTGAWNSIGSSNIIQSNTAIYDRSQLNAAVISYKNSGLLSIRQVINDGSYSGMEHLNVGGYNVIGSNNTLASGINIGDNVRIGKGVNVGDDVMIAPKSIFPANIGVVVVGNRIRIYGHEKLLKAGFVPYVFRRAKMRGHFKMKYQGNQVNPDRQEKRLKQKKGWRVHGSYHAYRIVDGELQFSLLPKYKWDMSEHGENFSGEVSALVRPQVMLEYNKDNERYYTFYVPYGRKRINGGRTYDLRTGLRDITIEYAIAFGLPIDSSYHPVTPADMITPLMKFSAKFSNARQGYSMSAAEYWDDDPTYWEYMGWTFGK